MCVCVTTKFSLNLLLPRKTEWGREDSAEEACLKSPACSCPQHTHLPGLAPPEAPQLQQSWGSPRKERQLKFLPSSPSWGWLPEVLHMLRAPGEAKPWEGKAELMGRVFPTWLAVSWALLECLASSGQSIRTLTAFSVIPDCPCLNSSGCLEKESFYGKAV